MRKYTLFAVGIVLTVTLFLPAARAAEQLFGQPPPPPDFPHYLCDEQRPLKEILLKRWAPYEFPLKIYLPVPPPGLSSNPIMHRRAVEMALLSWQRVWPRLSYTFVDKPVKNGVEFLWFNHVKHGQGNVWGSAYLPNYYRTPQKKVLHWSKVNLATRAHRGSALYRNQVIELSFREMRDLAIHEIGHALGLPHSKDGNDVMGGGNQFLVTQLNMRNISRRDVTTLNLIYNLPYSARQHPCPGQRFE